MKLEEKLAKLDKIATQLEGDIPLEKALQLFEEGTSLVKLCAKQLDEAELKVVKLMKGEDGSPVETEFRNENE